MGKDRREMLAVGELVFFVVAWVLGILASVGDYRVRHHLHGGQDVAATSDFTGSERPLK